MDISDDKRFLYLHCMYAKDRDAAVAEIDEAARPDDEGAVLMALLNPLSLPATLAMADTTWHGQLVVVTAEIGIVLIVAGMIGGIYRLLRGPHLSDRALAVDTIAIQLIGLVILLTIPTGYARLFRRDPDFVAAELRWHGRHRPVHRPASHEKREHQHHPGRRGPGSTGHAR